MERIDLQKMCGLGAGAGGLGLALVLRAEKRGRDQGQKVQVGMKCRTARGGYWKADNNGKKPIDSN